LKKVPWVDFSDAVTIFNAKREVVEAITQNLTKPLSAKAGLSLLGAMGATKLIQAKSQAIQRHHHNGKIEKKMSLEHLVCSLTSFDAGDPRDIIYALLPLAREASRQQLRPNYNNSLLQVYTEFVQHCIKISHRLDILCRHWTPMRTVVKQPDKSTYETTLPSWMSRLDRSAFGPPDKIFRGRRNADSLVNIDARQYNASGGHAIKLAEFGLKQNDRDKDNRLLNETFDGTLKARGLIIGKVGDLTPRIIPGKFSQELLAMTGWGHSLQDTRHSVNEVPDMLWRTLMADRNNQGQVSNIFYRRARLHCLQSEDVNGDVDIQDLMKDAPQHDGMQLANFLKRTQEVVWNRKGFLAGVDKEVFGLCPNEVQIGDVVCILYGCSVPVILRETLQKPQLGQRRVDVVSVRRPEPIASANMPATSRNRGGTSRKRKGRERTPMSRRQKVPRNTYSEASRDSTSSYSTPVSFFQLVGECYAHGIMDGEPIDDERYAGTERDFTLV
jgi:hypothetical protein